MFSVSPNTQAILLLTAPLITGRHPDRADILSPGEYRQLARRLRELGSEPARFLDSDAEDLIAACAAVADADRLRRLLARGFQLAQAVDRWQSRSVWVLSRADEVYPRRFKARLREDAPPVIYGSGERGLFDRSGLAVVGSRNADGGLLEYARNVGGLAARAGRMLMSGGARGIDQAAMQGAMEGGGAVCGVLADSLERAVLNRSHREGLAEGRLVLVSPYDPAAGFNVGNAMQRNKLIYALADVALIVSSDLEKGGTWQGAAEQLQKYRQVPVYVRAAGESSPGLDALRKMGALAWPEPGDPEGLEAVFRRAPQGQGSPDLFGGSAGGEASDLPENDGEPVAAGSGFADAEAEAEPADRGDSAQDTSPPRTEPAEAPAEAAGSAKATPISNRGPVRSGIAEDAHSFKHGSTSGPGHVEAVLADDTDRLTAAVEEPVSAYRSPSASQPAEVLYAAVRQAVLQSLAVPLKEADIAERLDVTLAQAKQWLARLVEEGVVEKRKKGGGYARRDRGLFR